MVQGCLGGSAGLSGGTAAAAAGARRAAIAVIAENNATLQKPIEIEVENCGWLLLNTLQPKHLVKIAII